MKTFKFLLCFICVFSITAGMWAQQSERPLIIQLTGFFQGEDALGNDQAIPFRYTTKDVLTEIGFYTGLDFTNGALLVIDSLTSTNVASQIVARKGATQVDVTDLFEINQGEAVQSSKFFGSALRSATLYSVDFFEFQTLDTDTNGLVLQMQLFSRETQRGVVKTIGLGRFDVITSTISFDGNGELGDRFGLYGPVKGTVKIGTPRYFP